MLPLAIARSRTALLRLLTVAAGGRFTLTSTKLSLNLATGAALKNGWTRYSSHRVRARPSRHASDSLSTAPTCGTDPLLSYQLPYRVTAIEQFNPARAGPVYAQKHGSVADDLRYCPPPRPMRGDLRYKGNGGAEMTDPTLVRA